MKKNFIALSALISAGATFAQSSVTLTGLLDVRMAHYSNKSEDQNSPSSQNPGFRNLGTTTKSQTLMDRNGNLPSRLGFRGNEDLGGGWAASFWIEATVSPPDGEANFFQRRSTLSLSGPFGEIRAGHDTVPTYTNNVAFDMFNGGGVGESLVDAVSVQYGGNRTFQRASRSLGYFLPRHLGGFYGQMMYAFPKPAQTPNASNNSRLERYVGGRFGYREDKLDVAAAYGSSVVGENLTAGTIKKVDVWNIAGSYDFGAAKAFGQYARSKQKSNATAPQPSLDTWMLGVDIPAGSGQVRFSYSTAKYKLDTPGPTPKAHKLALGYVHNLSKRTALYATVARISNKDGAGLSVDGTSNGSAFVTQSTGSMKLTPTTSTGFDFGIRHAF